MQMPRLHANERQATTAGPSSSRAERRPTASGCEARSFRLRDDENIFVLVVAVFLAAASGINFASCDDGGAAAERGYRGRGARSGRNRGRPTVDLNFLHAGTASRKETEERKEEKQTEEKKKAES